MAACLGTIFQASPAMPFTVPPLLLPMAAAAVTVTASRGGTAACPLAPASPSAVSPQGSSCSTALCVTVLEASETCSSTPTTPHPLLPRLPPRLPSTIAPENEVESPVCTQKQLCCLFLAVACSLISPFSFLSLLQLNYFSFYCPLPLPLSPPPCPYFLLPSRTCIRRVSDVYGPSKGHKVEVRAALPCVVPRPSGGVHFDQARAVRAGGGRGGSRLVTEVTFSLVPFFSRKGNTQFEF